MNTFNLAIVFGTSSAVVIVVCASENPINEAHIKKVASQSLSTGAKTGKELIDRIAKNIETFCGCNVLTVTADCACMVPTDTPCI